MLEIAKKDYGLKVIHIKADENYRDEFLFVCNNVPAEIVDAIDWSALKDIYKKTAPQPVGPPPSKNISDKHRGNIGHPVGVTGSHNSGRSMDTLGLARPRLHKATSNPTLRQAMAYGEEPNVCCQTM